MSQRKKTVSLPLTTMLYEPVILSIYSFLLNFLLVFAQGCIFFNRGSSSHGEFSNLKEESQLLEIEFLFRHPFFDFSNTGEKLPQALRLMVVGNTGGIFSSWLLDLDRIGNE